MSSDDQGRPRYQYTYEAVKGSWAILVTYLRHDYIMTADDDGVTPLTFDTEKEARAAATGPKYGPLLASLTDPWRITVVYEPYSRLWPREPKAKAKPAA